MKPVSGDGSLSSGELADLPGLSRDTLRHYERKGLLPRPLRGHNDIDNIRLGIAMIQLIRRALSIGFNARRTGKCLKFASRRRGK